MPKNIGGILIGSNIPTPNQVFVGNSIIAGNTATSVSSDVGGPSSPFISTSDYNLIGTDVSGTFPTGNNNKFSVLMENVVAPLGDNGGADAHPRSASY